MNESTLDKLFDDQPLLLFSLYTQTQSRIVIDFGQRLGGTLDKVFSASPVESDSLNEAYGLFWLWVLGAYEVIRTMHQYSNCFSSSVQTELAALKRSLHLVRIPFAKQELRGRKGDKVQYVYAELSISNVNPATKDIGFSIEGSTIWARHLVSEFEHFITMIKRDDVVGKMPLGNNP